MEAITKLSNCYPQLLLPIREGISKSDEYRNAVLRGLEINGEPSFFGSPYDCFYEEETVAGKIGIWRLGDRRDFEHALRALAYRCEPVEIPASVGANYIGGLINWEKIRRHKEEFFRSGGGDWAAEWKRFTAEKENYTDSIILLSMGNYSNLPANAVGLSEEEWKEKSYHIRKYHELTHFIYRRCYPGDVDVIRDEVLADFCGIRAAFGHYDASHARLCLGLDGDSVKSGGRITHYVSQEKLAEAAKKADFWISILENIIFLKN